MQWCCFLLAWECLPGSYGLFRLLVLRWGGHTQKAQSVVPLITLPTGLVLFHGFLENALHHRRRCFRNLKQMSFRNLGVLEISSKWGPI